MNKAASLLLIAVSIVAILASCRTSSEQFATEAAVELPPDPGWAARTVDTSITVELPEPFIKLVDLDRLRIGMTKQEVLAIFPNPTEIKLRSNDELWHYGFAQLIFRGNTLRDWFNLK